MANLAKPFERSAFKVAQIDASDNYGKFVIEPLERGYGLTIGNSLRRILLSSLPGASVCGVEIEGAQHEFSALKGIEEDVTSIILNLRDIIWTIEDEAKEDKKVTLSVKGPKVVKASDLELPAFVKIVNPDVEIAHVVEGGSLTMNIYVRRGRGYMTAENNKQLKGKIDVTQLGYIVTDSNYSPVTRASYSVEPARVGHDSRFDKLTLEVWTNGSILPQAAVALAAEMLVTNLMPFVELEKTAGRYTGIITERNYESKNYRERYLTLLEENGSQRSIKLLDVKSYNKIVNPRFQPKTDVLLSEGEVNINRVQAKPIAVTENSSFGLVLSKSDDVTCNVKRVDNIAEIAVEYRHDEYAQNPFSIILLKTNVKQVKQNGVKKNVLTYYFDYKDIVNSNIIPVQSEVSVNETERVVYRMQAPGQYALYNKNTKVAYLFSVQ